MTIVEFLLGCLDSDERVAKAVPPMDSWEVTRGYHLRFETWESDYSQEDADFVSRFNPPHILARLNVERLLIRASARDLHEQWARNKDEHRMGFDDWFKAHKASGRTLRRLASLYADREGFDPEWVR